jgi:hypothetical protein
MRFTAPLELHGKSATGIEVPPEVVEGLGGGGRPAVVATLNGYTYRSTLGVMGGRTMLPVSGEHRGAAGLTAGEEVEVDLALDTEPRTVEVPAELATALEGRPGARAAFDALPPSARKEHARQVTSAKAPETRARRIAKIVDALG